MTQKKAEDCTPRANNCDSQMLDIPAVNEHRQKSVKKCEQTPVCAMAGKSDWMVWVVREQRQHPQDLREQAESNFGGGPNFIHPHPHPRKYPSRSGGRTYTKRGGGLCNSSRGGLQNIPPLLSMKKMHSGQNGVRGGMYHWAL